MSTPEKESRPTCDRTTHAEKRNNATLSALSTAACGLCFLLAAHLTGTDQLIAISLGGLLATTGGAK